MNQCAAGMLHVRIAELSAEREAAAVADAQKQRLLHELEAEAQRVRVLALHVLPSCRALPSATARSNLR